MNIIFAGTPEFAKIQLEALLDAHFPVIAVYTQPDRPVGRGLKVQASAVKELALKAHIPIEQPINLKDPQTHQKFQSYKPDLLIVSAYGLLLPKIILDIPPLGCWNVHGSLLPRWRGAAPIQHAILAGDQQTGITLMQMDEGLDTGAMLAKRALDIHSTDTSAALHDKLAHIGADLLIDYLTSYQAGNPLNPIIQNNTQASLAPKINKMQAKLDWSQDALALVRAIHAFNPWPVAHTILNNTQIKIWDAHVIARHDFAEQFPKINIQNISPGTIINHSALGIDIATTQDILRITNLQFPDKRAMPVRDILNSKATFFAAGNRFS